MAVKMKPSLLRWCHTFVLPLVMIGTAYAQPQTLELPLSGWSLTLAEKAFAAYQRGDFSEARSLATEVMRMRPDVEKIRRLVVATKDKEGAASSFTMLVEGTPTVSRTRVTDESISEHESEGSSRKPPYVQRERKIAGHVAKSVRIAAAVNDKVRLSPGLIPKLIVPAEALEAENSSSSSSSASSSASALAQKVYDQIKAGDSKAAVITAEQAMQKYPGYKKLWEAQANALFAAGRTVDADRVIAQAISRFGLDDGLLVFRENVRNQLADEAANNVNRAMEHKDLDAAVLAATQTVVYAPDVMGNRLLLVHLLMTAGRFAEAERAASAAVTMYKDDALPLMMRGYVRQYLGQRTAAVADFDAVLRRADLTAIEQQNYRIIMADAALAAGDPQAVLSLLEPLESKVSGKPDAMLTWRHRTAVLQSATKADGAVIVAEVLRPLNLDCQASRGGRNCYLSPASAGTDPAYTLAAATYKEITNKNYVLALANVRQAVRLDPDNADYLVLLLNTLVLNGQLEEADGVASEIIARGQPSAQLLAQRGDIRNKLGQKSLAENDFSAALKIDTLPLSQEMTLLAQLNRKAEARARLDKALKVGESPSASDLDLAYLAVSINADDRASEAFERSDKAKQLSVGVLQDAAYTEMRINHDQQAIDYFTRAADVTLSKPLELRSSTEMQSLLAMRRNIAQLSREWGANATMSFRGSGAPGFGQSSSAASTDSVQLGAELYWRPFGFRNSKLFEVYARAFDTPYSRAGGLTGAASLQGSVGIRLKPWAESNLVLSLARLFPIGSKMNSDTLAQVAYFKGEGGELRTDAQDWWTQQYYAEAGRYFQHPQNYATGNARLGRSYRLDNISPDLVAFPHVVLAGDYNNAYTTRSAVGVGPGINFRYWYREDTYNSHRSFVDLSLQYRIRISGDEQRAKGTFLTLQTSY